MSHLGVVHDASQADKDLRVRVGLWQLHGLCVEQHSALHRLVEGLGLLVDLLLHVVVVSTLRGPGVYRKTLAEPKKKVRGPLGCCFGCMIHGSLCTPS